MPNSKGQVPISGNKEGLHIAEPHKIFGSTLEDFFVTKEGSARSLLASAGLYYGGGRSWTAFFSMLADAIKFFVTHPILFFDVIAVGNQIFEPEFKPGLLSELLTDKSFEEFIKKEENKKVVDDLMVKLSKIEEKDRGKLQEAATVVFSLLLDKEDITISNIPNILINRGLIAEDSDATKTLKEVFKCFGDLTVKGALAYMSKNPKAFNDFAILAKPLLEGLDKKTIDIKIILKGVADLLEVRAKNGLFNDFLKDTENAKKMLNGINDFFNKFNNKDTIVYSGVSQVINQFMSNGRDALPVILRRIADANIDLSGIDVAKVENPEKAKNIGKLIAGLMSLTVANRRGNYVFIDAKDLEIFKSGFENGGLTELKNEIKNAGLDWKYPEKNLHNIYFPKDAPLTNFRNSYMQDVSIIDATFKDTDFEGVIFDKSKIENCKLEGGNSKDVTFGAVEFEKTMLKNIKFQARDMYLECSKKNTCNDAFKGVSLLLKVERGDSGSRELDIKSVALIRALFHKPKAEQYLKKSQYLFCINMVS